MNKADNPGSTIKLGGCDWQVLETKDGKALVVSEKILSQRSYHSADEAITWKHSEMRRYLNGEFYETTFSAEEKGQIAETRIVNNDNRKYNTTGGSDTTDKVFLLSLDEAEKYFDDNLARTTLTKKGEESHWWLRSPGCEQVTAAYVEYDGIICYGYGHWSGILSSGGVRPALWLNQ